MQTHRPVTHDGLHLCDEEVTFLKEGAHLELVGFEFATLGRAHKFKTIMIFPKNTGKEFHLPVHHRAS